MICNRESLFQKVRTMLPIHTILHPTDFSERSLHALQLACALASDHSARLVVLHVAKAPNAVYGEWLFPPNPEAFFQEAKEQLNHLKIPNETIDVERRFETGPPAGEILRVAREIPADLIVIGTHGRTGLGRFLMGSVAEQVMRKADCPVLTVKSPFVTATAPGSSTTEMLEPASVH
jgi:nucleotide-binding universal stress UspA family protein